MKCWVCGAIYDDQSWSGRCEDCASAVDSGIETIGLDGLPIITDGYDLPLGDYDGQDDVIDDHSSRRFADDTGYYHQFHK